STTTERSAAPTASSEESEEDVEIGLVLPEHQGAELRRHPTLRPSGTGSEADGSRQAPVFTIHDSPRRALALLWRAGPEVYPVYPEHVVSAFHQGLEQLAADHS
ncbi:MAG: hypothetical protein VX327_03645, partial [Actinomycetota bacterium]|nr:hypothetical protein [Actinomycetota bacterium]